MPTALFTVEKSELTIDGKNYGVSNVSLGLALNSIPTCVVSMSPSYVPPGDAKLETLNLDTLKQAYQTLSSASKQLASASLTLELVSNGAERGISLKDWVIVGCGMHRISPVDVFSLEVTLAHSAYRLSVYEGCFFDSASCVNLDEVRDDVENPLQAFHVAKEAVDKANDEAGIRTLCREVDMSTPLKDPNEIGKELRSMSDLADALIDGVLQWNSGFAGADQDLPCEQVAEDRFLSGIRQAMVQAWLEPAGEDTVWSKITSVINPWFMTEVVPRFDEKHLWLVPTMPWKKPSMTLDIKYVAEFDMPAYDARPLYGVFMLQGEGSAPSAGTCTFQATATTGAGIQPANLAFVPAAAEKSTGSILHAQDPAWIKMAASVAASLPPTDGNVDTEPTVSFSEEDGEPDTAPAVDNEDMQVWNAVRMLYMCTLFMSTYRSSCTATLSCPLLSRPSGPNHYPGEVASVESEAGALFQGLVTNMTHNIDCVASRASTTIQLAYCDFDGATAELLGAEPKVPFYDSQATAGVADAEEDEGGADA